MQNQLVMRNALLFTDRAQLVPHRQCTHRGSESVLITSLIGKDTPADDHLIQPDEVFYGNVLELEICRAASVHQAERDGVAVIGDVNDLVGIPHLALDEISALGSASREIELGMRADRLAFRSYGRSSLRDDIDLVALAAGRTVGSVDAEQMDRRR